MGSKWKAWVILGAVALVMAGAVRGQAGGSTATGDIVTALMVSDIHLDPFHDPAKAKRLDAAPVSEWKAILAEPDAPDAAQAFTALQQKCKARGVDTPYALLESSLAAMRQQAPRAQMITVTGDLIAHAYPCRYQAAVGGDRYEEFVAKTIAFVTGELRASFPGVPEYVSLGNNDSGCADYKLDPGGSFLKATAETMTAGLAARDRAQAAQQFAAGGYYSAAMEPVRRTRVVVLNDIYWSPKYETCKGKADSAPGDAELAWLREQLASARTAGERVWILGHIPMGVNAFSTVAKMTNVCSGEAPEMFLNADPLDALLLEYADVVRLGLFAHTHMDEMRLLAPGGGAQTGNAGKVGSIAVKLVPSISPVDGNNPSFTVAQINAGTATLEDYRVVVSADKSGSQWTQDYDYRETYHEPDFSAASVGALVAGFEADKKGQQATSQAYIQHYFKGKLSGELAPFWGQYACSLDGMTAKAYAQCVCAQYK